MLKNNGKPGSSGSKNNQKFGKFQDSELSAKAAGKVLGGAGSSSTTCRQLEADFDAAVERGDLEEAQRIMRIIMRVCGFNAPF